MVNTKFLIRIICPSKFFINIRDIGENFVISILNRNQFNTLVSLGVKSILDTLISKLIINNIINLTSNGNSFKSLIRRNSLIDGHRSCVSFILTIPITSTVLNLSVLPIIWAINTSLIIIFNHSKLAIPLLGSIGMITIKLNFIVNEHPLASTLEVDFTDAIIISRIIIFYKLTIFKDLDIRSRRKLSINLSSSLSGKVIRLDLTVTKLNIRSLRLRNTIDA